MIFGVMGIINLAHGEFMMLGGFTVLVLVRRNVPVLAAVVVAPLAVGIIAFVIERGVIRFLYGRLIDTMLATWGLSLVIIQVMTNVFGSTTRGFAAPLGSFNVGRYRVSEYSLVLIASAVLLLAGAYFRLFGNERGVGHP